LQKHKEEDIINIKEKGKNTGNRMPLGLLMQTVLYVYPE